MAGAGRGATVVVVVVVVLEPSTFDHVHETGAPVVSAEIVTDWQPLTATPAGKTLTLTSTLAGYDGSVGEFQGAKSIIISLP